VRRINLNQPWRVVQGDVRKVLARIPDGSVHMIVTSPPYWGLRDYKLPKQVWGGSAKCKHRFAGERCKKCNAWRGSYGLEPQLQMYIRHTVLIVREMRRVLRSDGTLWLNVGDSYTGSWGNYSGKNRGNGIQRKIDRGSRVNSLAYDGTTDWRPPTSQKNTGLKNKDLCGVPWRIALALQSDGWYLRSDIIWHKPNPMPESVNDRPTKAHEYIFLLAKSPRYFYDAEATKEATSPDTNDRRPTGWDSNYGSHRELIGRYPHKVATPGEGIKNNTSFDAAMNVMPTERNKRTVWTVTTQGFAEAHFATFPEKLVEPPILAGTSARGCCPECGAPWKRDSEITDLWIPTCECTVSEGKIIVPPPPMPCIVLDPFCGAGTAGVVALRLGRRFLGIELKREYCALARKRIEDDRPLFNMNPEALEIKQENLFA